jgi:hypothetical protein
MSLPPVNLDKLNLSIKSLDVNLTLHPLIIIFSTLSIISLLINILYFSILLFLLFKKKKTEKKGSRTDLYLENKSSPPMIDPTKSNYLRL